MCPNFDPVSPKRVVGQKKYFQDKAKLNFMDPKVEDLPVSSVFAGKNQRKVNLEEQAFHYLLKIPVHMRHLLMSSRFYPIIARVLKGLKEQIKMKKGEKQFSSEEKPDLEKEFQQILDLVVEDLKDHHTSKLEPVDIYAKKVRSHLYSSIEEYRERLFKGYKALIEEVQKGDE